jgi:hypothetical protein
MFIFFLARQHTTHIVRIVMKLQNTQAKGHGDSAVRVTVQKSWNPKWEKWCAFTISFGGICEWFPTEAKAQEFAKSLRNRAA